MSNKTEKSQSMSDAVIQRLVRETGITEQQARDLVGVLGETNWSSLVREARLLNRGTPRR
ncbi:hypothetical protein SAMN03159463_05042 [Mesorhizobium sp. NFR06]|jgi:hypothetical protein|uniref:hypothetical protein n=1 Tax=Mesorhizobium sp. NFR06 TaxID=1566290 RepID=UPI0008EB14EF|nr:hypothetical protein [Mesorhizobium sp. NFR06]SFP87224.1 hypothetical protein SAMN03159463_05042 [Mesorhizobium sp. NFR06]